MSGGDDGDRKSIFFIAEKQKYIRLKCEVKSRIFFFQFEKKTHDFACTVDTI